MLKVRRQSGGDLSMGMLALLLAGAFLWLAYGLINQATAVIVANVAVIGLVSPDLAALTAVRESATRYEFPRRRCTIGGVIASFVGATGGRATTGTWDRRVV
jgi:hypothetical protein